MVDALGMEITATPKTRTITRRQAVNAMWVTAELADNTTVTGTLISWTTREIRVRDGEDYSHLVIAPAGQVRRVTITDYTR
jgi:hypothetical protein